MTTENKGLVERLEHADANSVQRCLGSNIFGEAAARIRELEAEVERLTPLAVAYDYLEAPAGREIAEARCRKLEEALRPFAEYLDTASFDKDAKGQPLPDDQGMGWVYLTIGHFRAARALLDQADGEEGNA